MKKTKKNNKGFSLVELIVVVLIMAIIAVSLAPQVMKWVEKSRVATDRSNYDALVSTVQLALIDGYPDEETTITMGTTTSITAGDEDFADKLAKVSPDWNSAVKKATTGADYTLKIGTDGKLTKSGPAEVTTD